MHASSLIRILALACAFACSGAFAQAAATPALRIKAVIDNVRNADTPAAQVTRLTNNMLPLAAAGANTAAWTQAQKAQAVLVYLKSVFAQNVAHGARVVTDAANTAAAEAAAATAAADMD